MLSTEGGFSTRIRSFIRRQGRLTRGQQQALERFGDTFCLDPGRPYDFPQEFGRDAPLILEIGFGNGESLVQMANENSGIDYLGIEVHRPGVGHLLTQLTEMNLNNVRVYCHDAVEILENRIANDSLAGIHLFFPDPWPKKKHHKRRIVRPDFVALIARKLRPGGYFHAATDWPHYAEAMLAELSALPLLINASPNGGYCQRPDYRPITKFERRGMALGHPIRDLIFNKQSPLRNNTTF